MSKNKNAVWSFFASVKLALCVLIVLAITSIIGTLIKQGQEPSWYVEEFGTTLSGFFATLNLTNMYSSWWFVALLCLLALNLLVCSIERLPGVWHQMVKDNLDVDPGQLAKMGLTHNIISRQEAGAVAAKMCQIMGRAGWRNSRQREQDESILLAVQKGAWSRLGVYVVHLSIIVILVGAIIGSLFGFQAYVFIPEGQATSNIYLRNTKEAVPLGFELQCDRFEKTFYPNGMIRQFRADLAVYETSAAEPYRKSIVVNDPLSYDGLTFYMGDSYPMDAYLVHVRNQNSGMEQSFRVSPNRDVAWEGTDVSFRIEELKRDQDGIAEQAKIHFISDGAEPILFWIKDKSTAVLRQSSADYTLSFRQLYSPLLLVKSDPGLWTVYSGFLLLVAGLGLSFFMSHRRIWVHIVPKGKQEVTILVSGTSNKHKPTFEKQFHKVVGHLNGAIVPACGNKTDQERSRTV